MNVKEIQKELRRREIDGWLFYDFHNRDAISYNILGLENKHTSRRWFYFIPASGVPQKLISKVEKTKLDPLPGRSNYYLSWVEQQTLLNNILGNKKTIAMQYSRNNNIPYISVVDAGVVELIRSFGHKIISSADLVSIFEARIDSEGYLLHKKAGLIIDKIRSDSFKMIRSSINSKKKLTEYELQQYILGQFKKNKIITSSAPIVGINDHPADPHFEPRRNGSYHFKEGDTVLLDIWGKLQVNKAIYYDITWVGFIGKDPPAKYIRIFNAVKDARDSAVAYLVNRMMSSKEKCYGWQVDDACRNVVKKHGYGKYFIHRTGHSIGTEVHGNGPNIDNLETKDERELLPGSCFSIEPGIYIPNEMAVRSEINVFIKNNGDVEVTGEKQNNIVLI